MLRAIFSKHSLPYFLAYADKSRIEDVIKQYASKTCVRFVPRTNQEDFIHIVSNGGCSSYVGRIGGAQKVSETNFTQKFDVKRISIFDVLTEFGSVGPAMQKSFRSFYVLHD